jgi:hypothetical protein
MDHNVIHQVGQKIEKIFTNRSIAWIDSIHSSTMNTNCEKEVVIYPDNFTMGEAKKRLLDRISGSDEMSMARKHILEEYENAISKKSEYFDINLTNYTAIYKAVILMELSKRFPYIGYKHNGSNKSIIKLIRYNSRDVSASLYIVAITESFGLLMLLND